MENNNISKIKENCVGCGSCSQTYQFGAIEMKEDRTGFLYPNR